MTTIPQNTELLKNLFQLIANQSEVAEQQRVREVLLTLKPRLARLLLLRYSGLSYAEIASALEIAPSSVGTLLARAEKAFEQAYDK